MKKGIVYILLFTYSALMLKPVIPYISDTLAHIFWYSEHMATVHYVNGKFHVHREVMEESKKNANDKSAASEKNEPTQQVHLLSSIEKLIIPPTYLSKHYLRTSLNILSVYLQSDYPPPKV